ncbi:MAG: TRAP transporter small permease [Spirochaetales bacterium]|jgi:TRAP-type C4-dicarboxylate transport system permease small subunit|nr:TRAP transporter small permease [Spirochaetales bacterium]
MKFLQTIKKRLDAFGRYWSLLALLLVLFPTLEAVVFRAFLNKPTIWSSELTTMIFGVYFMIGGARCEADNGHVVMDLFSSHYRGYLRIVYETFSLLVCAGFCVLLIYFGGKWALDVMMTGEKSETIWAPYLWPSRLAIPLGSLMLFIRTFITYTERVQNTLSALKEGKS